jgi:hypothetical protein
MTTQHDTPHLSASAFDDALALIALPAECTVSFDERDVEQTSHRLLRLLRLGYIAQAERRDGLSSLRTWRIARKTT